MERGTVHLNAKIAPGDKDWHQGYITQKTNGVTVNSDRDGRGEVMFYPWHQVQKITS